MAKNQHEGTFRRQLTWSPEKSPEKTSVSTTGTAGAVYFRAAVGKEIEQTENGFRVDGNLTIRVSGGNAPVLRKQGEQVEVLVPLHSKAGEPVVVTQEIDW